MNRFFGWLRNKLLIVNQPSRGRKIAAWLLQTVLAFVVVLILFYPAIAFALLFIPIQPAQLVFWIVFVLGIIFFPTFNLIAYKAKSFFSLSFVLILYVAFLVGSVVLGQYILSEYLKSQRTELLHQYFPPYPGSTLNNINHSLGDGFDNEAYSAMHFNLEGADKKASDVVCFYNQKLVESGWTGYDDRDEPTADQRLWHEVNKVPLDDYYERERQDELHCDPLFVGADWYEKQWNRGEHPFPAYKYFDSHPSVLIYKDRITSEGYSITVVFQ